MAHKTKTIVGLSGGVDSALAALLLKEQGHEVIGVTMSIFDKNSGLSKASGGACYDCDKEKSIDAARALAKLIGIDFVVCDCVKEYSDYVLKYFRDEYLSGRTPNPCVKCNHIMKFGFLPDMAREKVGNYDYFATGHYAQIIHDKPLNRYYLKRGIVEHKDQTYFLYRLTQKQLAKTLFPLGAFTKEQTRELAKQKGLPVHDKPDSQDFYSGDYNDLINEPPRPGNIVDINGKILGKHNGFWNFTIGQRRGMQIAYKEPLYVIALKPKTNEVVVGVQSDTYSAACIINDLSFNFEKPEPGTNLKAKARSAQSLKDVIIKPSDNPEEMVIEFTPPQQAITPGQSLVLYNNDIVIGGGIIKNTL